MNAEGSPEVARFRDVLERRLGLSFEGAKPEWLGELLERGTARARLSRGEYLDLLHDGRAAAESETLAHEVTITETYFFRHSDQLRALSDLVFDRSNPAVTPVRVLSAGCASGEEAYSLAMLTRDRLSNASILGIDVNSHVLERAVRARYSQWSLRGTASDVQARWFKSDGRDCLVDPTVRAMVRFELRNLVEDDPVFWRRDAFDAVLCRNVLMYFTPDAARSVVRRIAGSLRPGGFLFLGHAETLRGLSNDFDICHTHDTFYYQRRDELAEAGDEPRGLRSSFPASGSWCDTIERAAKRVTDLTEPNGVSQVTGEADTYEAPLDAKLAAELVHEDRFTELEGLLGAAPPELETDADRLLLRAVLLTRGGNVPAAERACERLLALDDTSSGGRYLLALCRESAGDRAGATEQDLMAAHADPSFSMPRLHLGLLARRAGDVQAARRQFAQAIALLEREDRSRLLLFGGGFSREALLGLCRAELLACGGAA